MNIQNFLFDIHKNRRIGKINPFLIIVIFACYTFISALIIVYANKPNLAYLAVPLVVITVIAPNYNRWLYLTMLIIVDISAYYMLTFYEYDILNYLWIIFLNFFLAAVAEFLHNIGRKRDSLQHTKQTREQILSAIAFSAYEFMNTNDLKSKVSEVLKVLVDEIGASGSIIVRIKQRLDGFDVESRYGWTGRNDQNILDSFFLWKVKDDTFIKHLEAGRIIAVNSKELNINDAAYLLKSNIQSIIIIPIIIDNKLWGTLNFFDVDKKNDWLQVDLSSFEIVGELFASALKNLNIIQKEKYRSEVLDAVAEASEKFLLLSNWRDGVANVLKRIGQSTEIDQIVIYQKEEDVKGDIYGTPVYAWKKGESEELINFDMVRPISFSKNGYARWIEVLNKGDKIFGNINDFPDNERGFLLGLNIKSIVVLPIFIDQKWWGFLTFESLKEKDWSEVIDIMNILSKILGAAVKKSESLRLIRQQELKLQQYFEAIENVENQIVITTPEGIIIYANKALERVTGFKPEEVIYKKIGSPELWGGLMDKEYYANMWKTIKTDKKIFQGEVTNKKKTGDMYVSSISISPVIDSNSGEVKAFVSIERDITKEKEVDKAKTEFVSLASHQLRTPLTSMKWYLEILLSGDAGVLNKTQMEYIDLISQSNDGMIDLVNALLNVSRIDLGTFAIEPKPVDILKAAQLIMQQLEPNIRSKKIELITKFNIKSPTFNLDKELIEVVFQNLLSNAIKYTPEGGKVEFSISESEAEIMVDVKDNGYGIPKEQQPKIFTKLFRAENIKSKVTEGTGLGLYIVKSIIDKSGGTISFESEEGKGTVFHVILPKSGMPKVEGEKRISK